MPDPNLYLYDDIGAIGIELWQVNSNTIYDNIIITDSIEEAKVMFKKNKIGCFLNLMEIIGNFYWYVPVMNFVKWKRGKIV